jgi:hypothetical protein
MPRAGQDADGAHPPRRSLTGKLLDADPADVGLALEAVFAIGLAQAVLRLVSLATVGRACCALAAAGPSPRMASGPPLVELRRLAWAVDAASARTGGACLVRSVALLAMLARRGRGGVLCIAFRNGPGPLPGHAWVEVDGESLGADGAAARVDHRSGFEVLSRLVTGEDAGAA